MKTSVTELSDSRVRVEVDVPADDVDRGIGRAARGLARDLRLPGFRKGKAPPSLIIQRVGREAVMEQAVRDSLPEWYERALLDSGVDPVGDPSIEVTSVPEAEGEPLSFHFEVGVRPAAALGDYKGLEVGRPEPEVPEEMLEEELERLRQSAARLEPVDRPAGEGDYLLVDFRGEIDGKSFEGGEGRDQLLELGGGQLVEGFDEQLTGAAAGDQRRVDVHFPDDYQGEQLAGRDATFEVTVKEVREKILPEFDDEFAASATGLNSVDELREDIRGRLLRAVEQRINADFRIAAVDAAVEASEVEIPEEIVAARAAERWERIERQLTARGIDPSSYLQMQSKTRDEVIEESRPDAEQEMKREAVLAAIADAESLEASEGEMLEALEHSAEHERTTPEKLLERLRKAGRDALVRQDIRIRKAIDVLAENAKPIPLEQAEAREKLWTPEKEREEGGELWTPGSGEE